MERIRFIEKAKSVSKILLRQSTKETTVRIDDKPSADVRDVLKSYGFRWAPSYSAWQRHLNSNGKYAVKKVLEILKDIAKEVI